jgi:hypothetical protein
LRAARDLLSEGVDTMSEDLLTTRIRPLIGRPAATVVASDDVAERQMLPELTFSAVVLYLIAKYLDGFVEGLGVKKLGTVQGRRAADLLRRAKKGLLDLPELESFDSELSRALQTETFRDRNAEAVASGERAVASVLLERGVIETEARAIARGISVELRRGW